MDTKRWIVLSTMIAAVAFSVTGRAASIDWDNQSKNGLWTTAVNWSTDAVPTSPDDAVFIDPAVGPAVINADVPAVRDMRFGDDGRVGSGTVNHTAGNVQLDGWFRMGISGGSAGIYNLSGGQITAGRYNIAESGGSTGTVNVTGGTFRQSDVADVNNGDTWNRVGQDGDATINLSGTGTISFDSRTLVGAGAGSSALINQTGGTLEVRRGELTLADSSANAVYKISGGTLRTLNFHQDGNSGGNITVGEWDNSNARMEISGTAVVQAATNFAIAQGRVEAQNQGTVVQSGGTVTFGGNGQLATGDGGAIQDRSLGGLLMAANTSSTATYELSGGELRQNEMFNREDTGSWNTIGQNGNATFNISGGTASFDARTLIASGAGAVATVNQTGGVFEIRNHELIIGDSGKATYNISAGTLQTLINRPIVIGNWDNGDSQLNVSGTAQVKSGGNLIVGGGRPEGPSKGALTQTGGTISVTDTVAIAAGGKGTGVYNLSGGEVTARRFNIGQASEATGTLNVSAGTLRQNDAADITNGDNWSRIGQDGRGEVNLSGTGLISFDSRLIIGGAPLSSALITQTGGTFEVRRGEFDLGDQSPNAVYKISGGTLRTLNFSENGDTGGNITVGQWDNSNGQLEISGTAVVQAATNVQIADGRVEAPNAGTITQSGGTFTFGGNGQLPTGDGGALQDRSFGALLMARTASGTATYNLSGGELRQNDMFNREDQGSWNRIGQEGNATFNISGGTASFDARTLLATNPGSVATVEQTGGTFEVRNHELIIGDQGKATYNISGGTLQTLQAGRPIVVGNWDNSDAQLNVSANGTVISGGNLVVGGGQASAPSKGVVTQTGGFVTVNDNVVIASGNANQTGTYNLQGGVLDVTGGNIDTGAGVGTFNMTGGELRNVSVIDGNSATAPTNPNSFVQAGGRLVVGETPGAGGFTTVNGNYSLQSAAFIQLEISDGIADRVAVNGTVTLAGIIELFAPLTTPFPQSFTILENDDVDPVSGFFANAPQNTDFVQNGITWRINYQGGDGNDVVLTLVVPEPGTAALLLAGAAFGLTRRRRTNR